RPECSLASPATTIYPARQSAKVAERNDSAAYTFNDSGIFTRVFASDENKMSDGGRGRALLGVEVWKSSQEWSVERSAVRSIAWLDRLEVRIFTSLFIQSFKLTNKVVE